MDAEYGKDTYLSDVPKDRPLFKSEYMNKYLEELDARPYTGSYDFKALERRILARGGSFEVRQDPSTPRRQRAVETPVSPIPVANPRTRKMRFD